MGHVEGSQLGKETVYDHPYDPGLLFPIPRAENRAKLEGLEGLSVASHIMRGEDLWTCYELSWLTQGGKPQVGIATFSVPLDSPFIIESKSFKLYLNSLNHKSFDSIEELSQLLQSDLSEAAGAQVRVDIDSSRKALAVSTLDSVCIDDIDAENFVYQPDPNLLKADHSAESVEQSFYSELLRSNCPVTGQPDWGTVYIECKGKPIDPESLLRYIVSFRQCQDFHEHCVERMFVDILQYCQCQELMVYARYTRRGGLDINPYRSTRSNTIAPNWRTSRQ